MPIPLDDDVRRARALNPNTPLPDLLILIHDGFAKEVMVNPAWKLIELARPDLYPNLPIGILKRLLELSEPPLQLFHCVLDRNHEVGFTLLYMYGYENVLDLLVQKKNCPLAVFKKAASVALGSGFVELYNTILEQDHCPDEVRQYILESPLYAAP